MHAIIAPHFLLQSETAQELYHLHAAPQPIIDYHCHLNPALIASNHRFQNISQLWLAGDHYKWRAMRANGIPEEKITGSATDEEKFHAWAATVPYTLRNPLYHWTHLELHRYFGITDLLSLDNAAEVYAHCNELLAHPDFSVQGLLAQMRVQVVCTTDDPCDDLQHHLAFAQQGDGLQLRPTFRPDNVIAVDNVPAWNAYVERLSAVSGIGIRSFDSLMDALAQRHDFFAEAGCRLSDHGLETMFAAEADEASLETIFQHLRSGKSITALQKEQFSAGVLHRLALLDHDKGWVAQWHLGALRNNNSRLQQQLGADAGVDSVGDFEQARKLNQFLNQLEAKNALSKTILYNLDPAKNEVFATAIGNFQSGAVPGKIQFGSGWWFLDQKDGMEKQINALSNMGLLSRFVGMLTDSRSFLSFPRHEYFRRVLCNLLGADVEAGLIPDEAMPRVRQMVEDICYGNAKSYFGF